MAHECTENSSSTSPWWDHQSTSLSSWATNTIATTTPWHQQNPNSNSSCDEISTSFTNTLNHSKLVLETDGRQIVDSSPSSNELTIGEHAQDTQLWSNFLFNGGSQSMSHGILEPACDYLKNMDNNWEFTNSSSFNNFDKLSNSINSWSVTPPDNQEVKFDQQTHENIGFLSCYDDHGIKEEYPPSERNFSDVISFNSRFTKPFIDIQDPRRCFDMPDFKKKSQVFVSSQMQTNGKGKTTNNEGKRKRCEGSSETTMKQAKLANSESIKAPKVKFTDRITTLQQIVAPFGKTDTASVLYEAIQCIKCLQEQVQLLINPYMKINNHYKDLWGGMRIEDGKIGLRSRGLVLVPISCTPQVYKDNTGSDFWTPTYRGSLYR